MQPQPEIWWSTKTFPMITFPQLHFRKFFGTRLARAAQMHILCNRPDFCWHRPTHGGQKTFPHFWPKQNKLVLEGKLAIIRDLTSNSRHCHLIAEKVLEELPLSNQFHGSVKIHEYWTWSLCKVKFHRLATIICWNHQNYPKSLGMNDGYIYFPGKCTLKPGNMRGTNIRAVSQ